MIDGTCKTRRVKLSDLNPAPYNPRKISDTAFEGLENSIERFGMLSLIVWNKRTGNIVGGHQRYKALLEAGETETEVVVVDLEEGDEVALNISLNNRAIRGDFTSEVMELLELTEVRMGSAFNDLHLNDLHSRLKKVKWEKTPPKDNQQRNDEPPPPSSDNIDDEPEFEEDENDPEAVIKCPECSSRWRMEDDRVIHNAKEGNADAISVDG